MNPLSLLRHPLLALENYRHKTELIRYCNANGFKQRYGYELTPWRLNRHPEVVQEFLDSIQQELEFQQFASQVEVAPTTQRPHEERELEYNLSGMMQALFEEPQPETPPAYKQPLDDYLTYLDNGQQKLLDYINDETQHDVDGIDLEPTVAFQTNPDQLTAVQDKLQDVLRRVLREMTRPTSLSLRPLT